MVIELYIYYNPNPAGSTSAEDCVIRAIAKATNTDWQKVYAALCVYGFAFATWGNKNAVWDAYLRDLGYQRHIVPNTCPNCYTVADFARDNPTGTYILGIGDHAVPVQDGDWYDSWDSGGEVPILFYTMEVDNGV